MNDRKLINYFSVWKGLGPGCFLNEIQIGLAEPGTWRTKNSWVLGQLELSTEEDEDVDMAEEEDENEDEEDGIDERDEENVEEVIEGI